MTAVNTTVNIDLGVYLAVAQISALMFACVQLTAIKKGLAAIKITQRNLMLYDSALLPDIKETKKETWTGEQPHLPPL